MSQPESKLSRDIMTALRARGVFCFKVHGGPTMMAGLPDIIACVPTSECPCQRATCRHTNRKHRGLFVGFETKTPSGKEPTPIQHRVHFKIGQAYGRVFVVRSVQDAVAALRGMGVTTPPDNTD